MPELPSGTVTFLFTDIEGSTPLWERNPQAMHAALARHHAILHAAIQEHGGHVFQIIGDAFCAAFSVSAQAIAAALAAQRALNLEPLGETGPLRVRMGIHTGPAEAQGTGYLSNRTLNRAQRIMAAGHGGQILLSLAVAELARGQFPPGIRLKDLGERHLKGLSAPERLFQVNAPDLPADFPPLKTEDRPRHNLPNLLTPLIGREKEAARVKALLEESRCVTLTGSGGVGKTRLGLQVGEELYADSPDGVWLVELAQLSDADLIPHSLATVFGLRVDQDLPVLEAVEDFLQPRQLLLLLDNCEHLIDACARLAHRLLQACPDLRILATSREALGVDGERMYPVPSLSFPDPRALPAPESLLEYEAVRLFVARARAVLPDFRITGNNASSLVKVISRLDGIPLAIELAAARVKMLRVDQIAARLDDSFRLLAGGSRTALSRHQTLRALVDWSHSLLSARERALLRRLSIFSGGWTLEAAEAVCSRGEEGTAGRENPDEAISSYEILDLLTSLSNKSLVETDRAQGEEPRYRLLETIRQYAREKLLVSGESEILRTAHLRYFLDLAERAEPQLWRADQKRWLDLLERDYDNLRSALAWSAESPAEGEVEAGIRLVVALEQFWFVRSHWMEADRFLGDLLGRPDSKSNLRVYAHGIRLAARFKMEINQQLPIIHSLLEESLGIGEALGDRWIIARAYHELGTAHSLDIDNARRFFEKSLVIYRDLNDKPGQAVVLSSIGRMLLNYGEDAAARPYYEENLKICRELGHRLGIAGTLIALGIILSFEGKWTEAEAAFAESLSIYRSTDDRSGVALALRLLAHNAFQQGEHADARSKITEVVSIARDINDKPDLGWGLILQGDIDLAQGNFIPARAAYEEALSVFKGVELRFGIVAALASLGMVSIDQNDIFGAKEYFKESLVASLGVKKWLGMEFILLGIAKLANTEGRSEASARLLSVIEPRKKMFGPLENAEYEHLLASIKAQLPAAAFETAWAEGLEMRNWDVDEVIRYALEKL